MEPKIGYIGKLDKIHKIFYDGCEFYTEINGRYITVDYDAVHYSRKSK